MQIRMDALACGAEVSLLFILPAAATPSAVWRESEGRRAVGVNKREECLA